LVPNSCRVPHGIHTPKQSIAKNNPQAGDRKATFRDLLHFVTSHQGSAADRASQVLLTLIDVAQSENVVMDASAIFVQSDPPAAHEVTDKPQKGTHYWSIKRHLGPELPPCCATGHATVYDRFLQILWIKDSTARRTLEAKK
jgi:hypothetical protein